MRLAVKERLANWASTSDAVLVNVLVVGDERALSELHKRYNREVKYYLVKRFHLDVADADDIVNKAWTSCFKYAKSYNPELGAFKAWFYKIATRTALNFLRDNKRHQQSVCMSNLSEIDKYYYSEHPSDDLIADKKLEYKNRLAPLLDLLATDSAKHHTFSLFLNGKSIEEIAEIQKIDKVTVRTRIFKARKELAKIDSEGGAIEF